MAVLPCLDHLCSVGPLACGWTTWFTKYGGPTERKWSNRTQVVQAGTRSSARGTSSRVKRRSRRLPGDLPTGPASTRRLEPAPPFPVEKGSIIVAEEVRRGPGTIDKNQKIPNIAEEHRITCINFLDLLRARGWRF